MDKFIASLFDGAAYLGAVIGGYFVTLSINPSLTAPQAGAMAAVGIGFAAVPYCIASLCRKAYMCKLLERLPERPSEPINSDASADYC